MFILRIVLTIRNFKHQRLRIVYTNIDQILVNLLHGLLNCEIGGLDCHIMKTEYRTRVHCLHMYHLFYNALVHVIYLGVSGQCSHTLYNNTLYNTCNVC